MAAITVNIDDNTYEHALAMFAFRGKTAEEAIQELFERAAFDEEPIYTHIPLNAETIKAIEECERGENLIGPFETMEELWAALNDEDDEDA